MKCVLQEHEMSLIKKMENEASKLSNVVSLAQWIPWYPTPDAIQEFVLEKIKSWQTNRYSITAWIPQLRQQIALRYYQKLWVDIDFQNEIVITAGAIQAISSILLTFVWQDDEVILIDPCYASYSWCIMASKWKPNYVSLDDNLDLDVDNLISSINENTKAIIIANPNNPTWSIFSIEKLRKILDYIKDKEIVLVVDEVYDEFLFDWNEFLSAVSLYEEYKSNLIIVNSWSKSFWMTWWRVWYFLADSCLSSEIVKVHDWLITCAPVHSQWAALASFEIYDSWTEKVRKDLQKRRDYAVKELQKLSAYIEFDSPSAAYFIFWRFKYTKDDYNECLKILNETKLALVPWSGFWERWKWYFRLCFGRDFDDLQEWISRLEKYFRK